MQGRFWVLWRCRESCWPWFYAIASMVAVLWHKCKYFIHAKHKQCTHVSTNKILCVRKLDAKVRNVWLIGGDTVTVHEDRNKWWSFTRFIYYSYCRDFCETGYILGMPNVKTAEAVPQRALSPVACTVMRLLLHAALIIGVSYGKKVLLSKWVTINCLTSDCY